MNVAEWTPWLNQLASEHALNHEHIKQWLAQAPSEHPLVFLSARATSSAPESSQRLESYCRWLAGKQQLPYVEIDPLATDIASSTQIMSYDFAEHYNLLALQADDSQITVATADPLQREWEAILQQSQRKSIRCVCANPLHIKRYREDFYRLHQSLRGMSPLPSTKIHAVHESSLMLQEPQATIEAQPTVHVVDWLLRYAFTHHASDIHLEPKSQHGEVRLRLDGLLHPIQTWPTSVMTAVISRFKILAHMDVSEQRLPQDGRLKTTTPDGRHTELRLATLPTALGEKLVIRIFNDEIASHHFAALGMRATEEQAWRDLLHSPSGLILVSGPTGSGKTTTLYSSLHVLAHESRNICTIEDPIERIDSRYNQTQVHTELGLSFHHILRALLRQDPNIIMVGEIRDSITAEAAIQAALTGHLILSTLHTPDAISAILRLQELGIPNYLLRACMKGVLAQRLIRVLCATCKKKTATDAALWQQWFGQHQPMPKYSYGAVGCSTCRNTGYQGRQGVYELLLTQPILQNQSEQLWQDKHSFLDLARQHGFLGMRDDAAQKIIAGITSFDEVMRVVP